jgi:hypothetical protein
VASRIFVNEHHPQAKSRKISLFSIYGQSNWKDRGQNEKQNNHNNNNSNLEETETTQGAETNNF